MCAHLCALQAAKAAGWVAADNMNTLVAPPKKVALEHAHFGVITGENGKKLSSREGVEYTLADLVSDGILRAEAAIKDTAPVNDDERRRIALSVASGAIRYFDLSHNRKTNYEFSFDRVLSFKGNAAACLLYATTRLRSLLRQLEKQSSGTIKVDSWGELLSLLPPMDTTLTAVSSSQLSSPAERHLALELVRFRESVDHCARQLLPNVLTDYLYTLSTAFHSFYEHVRILPEVSPGADGRPGIPDFNGTTLWRLHLCAATDATLRAGFSLVGLSVVDRM